MQDPKLTDKNGRPVAIGDIVRIVKLSQDFIENFPEQDRVLIETMIGQLFKIYGIDEFGQPWVSKEFHDEDGKLQSHIIALDPDEMERI
jgi:hypothetical protein